MEWINEKNIPGWPINLNKGNEEGIIMPLVDNSESLIWLQLAGF